MPNLDKGIDQSVCQPYIEKYFEAGTIPEKIKILQDLVSAIQGSLAPGTEIQSPENGYLSSAYARLYYLHRENGDEEQADLCKSMALLTIPYLRDADHDEAERRFEKIVQFVRELDLEQEKNRVGPELGTSGKP